MSQRQLLRLAGQGDGIVEAALVRRGIGQPFERLQRNGAACRLDPSLLPEPDGILEPTHPGHAAGEQAEHPRPDGIVRCQPFEDIRRPRHHFGAQHGAARQVRMAHQLGGEPQVLVERPSHRRPQLIEDVAEADQRGRFQRCARARPAR